MYHSIKDAPKTLQRLSSEIEIMAVCLRVMEQRRQRQSCNPATDVLDRCITSCQQATDDTQELVDKMARRLDDNLKRGKLYIVFKEKDMQQLLSDLERTKSSIQLAYYMYQAEEQRQRDEVQGQLLEFQRRLLEGLPTRMINDMPHSNANATVSATADAVSNTVMNRGKSSCQGYQ